MQDNFNNDHDLLVQLHEQIKQVRIDIQNLTDGTTAKVLDHESRIRRLESWGLIAIGFLYAIEVYFHFVIK